MQKLTKIFGLVLAFSLLAVALSFLTSIPAPAQSETHSVKVVNSTASPVPTSAQGTTTVAGQVAISGTPTVALASGSSVNVNSLPAVQLANGSSVNVVGTTTVLLSQTMSPGVPVSLDTSAYHQIRVSIRVAGLAFAGTATIFAADAPGSPIEIARIGTSPRQVGGAGGTGSTLIELPGRSIQISAEGITGAGLPAPVEVLVEGR